MPDDLSQAHQESRRAANRLKRMKVWAGQATAAKGGFPYCHRTLDQIEGED